MNPIFHPSKPDVGYFENLEQGTPEWLELRKGKVTGTSAYKILQGESIQDILAENNAGKEFLGNKYTARGHDLEEYARQTYSELTGNDVAEVGAVINTKYPDYLCSPDGIVFNGNGGIEIKAFGEERQEDVFQNLDPHIIAQIQFCMFITESDWWDWVLFNPDVNDLSKAYHCKRFFPDENIFEKFTKALDQNDDTQVEETALEIINLETELQQISDRISDQLTAYNSIKSQIEDLKENLKTNTTGRIKKTVELNGNTLGLSIYDSHRVSVDDPSEVEKEYTTKTKLEGVYQDTDGNFYKDEPNTRLVSNLYKTGKPLPKGFKLKTSRSISIKFNGEAL